MKTLVTVIGLVSICVVLAGCTRFRAASVPSDQKGAPMVITPQQVALLGKGVENDVQVLASALESNAEGGSVIYVDHNGYLFGPDGKLLTDPKTGEALKVRTKIVAKLHSLQDFAGITGVKKVRYEVGGRSYLASLPDGLKHMDGCPVPLMLEIEGADTVTIKSPVADQRLAAAKEREAIYDGMSELAEAEGAAWAQKVTATSDGMVKVITAASKELIGRVLGLTPLETAIEGASNVTKAKILADSGKTTTVVAEGDAAAALVAAQK